MVNQGIVSFEAIPNVQTLASVDFIPAFTHTEDAVQWCEEQLLEVAWRTGLCNQPSTTHSLGSILK